MAIYGTYGENEELITRITVMMEKHLGSMENPIWVREIPTGLFNTSYLVVDGRREFVLRVAPPDDWGFVFYEENMMAREPLVHRLVRERTDVRAPAILAYDDDRDLMDASFLIMERLPGEPLSGSDRERLERALRGVGESLAQIHSIHGPGYGYPPGGTRTPAPGVDWTEVFFELFRLMVEDCLRTGGYDSDEGAALLDALERSRPAFTRTAPPSLLHMDIWAENILADREGGLTGIVDWDRAMWGDPEIEFAVLDYCGISGPAFWAGYGAEPDRSPEAGVRSVLYLLYELQKYIVIHRTRRFDPVAADSFKARVFKLVRPLQ